MKHYFTLLAIALGTVVFTPLKAQEDLIYVAVNPCRIVDTREAGGAITANDFRNFLVSGSLGELAVQGSKTDCLNPKTGTAPLAISAYVIAVPTAGSTAGVLTAYPSDHLPPPVGAGSTVNFAAGQVIGNTTNITLCAADCPTDGEFAVLARSTDEHVVIDVQGYFYPIAKKVPPNTLPRFVDGGNGTVSDNQTGLMWEKKSLGSDGFCNDDIHCVLYSWTWSRYSIENMTRLPNGSAFFFIDQLNNVYTNDTNDTCFAGYCDWRMPTMSELRSILKETAPYIDPVFGPVPDYEIYGGEYWTFSTAYGGPIYTAGENLPWVIDFSDGTIFHPYDMNAWAFVRVVRRFKEISISLMEKDNA